MKDWVKKNKWFLVIALIITLFFSYQSTKNRLIDLYESVDASWAQVENQLQRRYDLIPNLAASVKGYAMHEKEVFSQVADARSKLASASSTGGRILAANKMESALSRLLLIVERYPNLKASQNYRAFIDELSGTENRLAVERRRFNEHVRLYNRSIRIFPYRYIALAAGFKKMSYFQVDSQAKDAPKVIF